MVARSHLTHGGFLVAGQCPRARQHRGAACHPARRRGDHPPPRPRSPPDRSRRAARATGRDHQSLGRPPPQHAGRDRGARHTPAARAAASRRTPRRRARCLRARAHHTRARRGRWQCHGSRTPARNGPAQPVPANAAAGDHTGHRDRVRRLGGPHGPLPGQRVGAGHDGAPPGRRRHRSDQARRRFRTQRPARHYPGAVGRLVAPMAPRPAAAELRGIRVVVGAHLQPRRRIPHLPRADRAARVPMGRDLGRCRRHRPDLRQVALGRGPHRLCRPRGAADRAGGWAVADAGRPAVRRHHARRVVGAQRCRGRTLHVLPAPGLSRLLRAPRGDDVRRAARERPAPRHAVVRRRALGDPPGARPVHPVRQHGRMASESAGR